MWRWLQPYAVEAATLCIRGCNVSEAATVCSRRSQGSGRAHGGYYWPSYARLAQCTWPKSLKVLLKERWSSVCLSVRRTCMATQAPP